MRSEDGTRKFRTYGEAKRKKNRPDPPNPKETSNNLKLEDMGMTLNDIGKALWKALSAMVTAASGIALCVGSLAIGIATEILLGVLSFVFGILITTASLVGLIALMVWLLTI